MPPLRVFVSSRLANSWTRSRTVFMTTLVLRHAYCPGLPGIFRPSVSTQPFPVSSNAHFITTVVASIEMVTYARVKVPRSISCQRERTATVGCAPGRVAGSRRRAIRHACPRSLFILPKRLQNQGGFQRARAGFRVQSLSLESPVPSLILCEFCASLDAKPHSRSGMRHNFPALTR